jgi:hypothetical protein
MSPDIYSEAKAAPELMRERGGVAPGSSLKPTLFQYTKLCLLKMNVMVLQEKKNCFFRIFHFCLFAKTHERRDKRESSTHPHPQKNRFVNDQLQTSSI